MELVTAAEARHAETSARGSGPAPDTLRGQEVGDDPTERVSSR